MDNKQKSKAPRGKVTGASVLSPRRQDDHSIDMLTGSRDPAFIVNTLRENWTGPLQHQRSLSTSRAYAELVKLLDGPGGPIEPPHWGKVKFYLDLLK